MNIDMVMMETSTSSSARPVFARLNPNSFPSLTNVTLNLITSAEFTCDSSIGNMTIIYCKLQTLNLESWTQLRSLRLVDVNENFRIGSTEDVLVFASLENLTSLNFVDVKFSTQSLKHELLRALAPSVTSLSHIANSREFGSWIQPSSSSSLTCFPDGLKHLSPIYILDVPLLVRVCVVVCLWKAQNTYNASGSSFYFLFSSVSLEPRKGACFSLTGRISFPPRQKI